MAVRQAQSVLAGDRAVSGRRLHDVLGLVRLTARTRSFPWANS